MRKLALPFLVLVANSAYLAAHADATIFYAANVVLHLVLGALLTVLALIEVRGWRAWPRLLLWSALPLALGAGTGLALVAVGASRRWTWLLNLHIGATTLGAVLVLAWMASRLATRTPRAERVPLAVGLAVRKVGE